MESNLQQQIAFFLTGRRYGSLEPLDDSLRPALLARYADLTTLRYDLPLILNRDAAAQWAVLSLSRLVDEAVENLESNPERTRIARHAYRIERELRRELAGKRSVDLETSWRSAADRIARTDTDVQDSADLLWATFQAKGDVIDADIEFPVRTISHAWTAIQASKAKAFRKKADQLRHALGSILAAEAVGSAAGRAPERLKAGVGTSFANTFDFDAMSELLTTSKPEVHLSDQRRQRIKDLLIVLDRQRFYPIDKSESEPYRFAFDSCEEALSAYNERYLAAVELTKTLAMAELEAAGEYREAVHDVLFESFGANGLDAAELANLPDYLVCTDGVSAGPAEAERILQLLTAGVPFKILLQSNDVFEPSGIAKGHAPFASRTRCVVNAAIGLTDVFVLQASASQLFCEMGSVLSGLAHDGPALFSVFSGATESTAGTPPYLVAAAAAEARIFPTLKYDPSAGGRHRDRFSIDDNPQTDNDWPVYKFEYEGEKLEALSEDLAFTAADFMAMDSRFRKHFALVPETADKSGLLSVADAVDQGINGVPDKVPFVSLVDRDGQLRRAVIDDRTLQNVRRCRNMWNGIQQLAERVNPVSADLDDHASDQPAPIPTLDIQTVQTPETVKTEPQNELLVGDDPYIETERCTTCNECTILNNRMFTYNENKQAFIADADAGTFRQLVEAAEGCQVSIIHPGKPRNPKEPGLEDLIRRAAEFA